MNPSAKLFRNVSALSNILPTASDAESSTTELANAVGDSTARATSNPKLAPSKISHFLDSATLRKTALLTPSQILKQRKEGKGLPVSRPVIKNPQRSEQSLRRALLQSLFRRNLDQYVALARNQQLALQSIPEADSADSPVAPQTVKTAKPTKPTSRKSITKANATEQPMAQQPGQSIVQKLRAFFSKGSSPAQMTQKMTTTSSPAPVTSKAPTKLMVPTKTWKMNGGSWTQKAPKDRQTPNKNQQKSAPINLMTPLNSDTSTRFIAPQSNRLIHRFRK